MPMMSRMTPKRIIYVLPPTSGFSTPEPRTLDHVMPPRTSR
jgi:hypothetical protein